MKLKKCTKCGGQDFYIQEIIFHEASLSSDDSQLSVYKERANGIERIFCKKCDADYSEDNFNEINFR
ncbi:MAG: hypothetical protein WC458_02885 [Patescibacteria group bacterium]